MATAKKNTPDLGIDINALLDHPEILAMVRDLVTAELTMAPAQVQAPAPAQAPAQAPTVNPERMIAHAVSVVDDRISAALSTESLGAALEAYEASKDTAWYESKWVIGGAALVAAGAVGYGIYRANKRAGQALETAGAAANTLKAFGPVAGDDGVITLTNCRMGS
jgi:hypothetical protein